MQRVIPFLRKAMRSSESPAVGNIRYFELKKGFKKLSTKNPQYDENKIMELWNKKYPDFIGYNCRITAFDLMKDKISVKAEAKPFIMENTKTAL